jgi:hypothetical protein
MSDDEDAASLMSLSSDDDSDVGVANNSDDILNDDLSSMPESLAEIPQTEGTHERREFPAIAAPKHVSLLEDEGDDENVDADSAMQVPLPRPIDPPSKVSSYIEGQRGIWEGFKAKKKKTLEQCIVSHHCPNPNVRKYGVKEKPSAIIKAALGKKTIGKRMLADKVADFCFDYIVAARVDQGGLSCYIYGYLSETNGHTNVASKFTPLMIGELVNFHPPTFDASAFANATQDDFLTMEERTTSRHETYDWPICDIRYVLKKLDETDANAEDDMDEEEGTAKKKKKASTHRKRSSKSANTILGYDEVHQIHAKRIERAREIVNQVQGTGIYMARTEALSKLKARVGPLFPELKSHQVDGLRSFPENFHLDQAGVHRDIFVATGQVKETAGSKGPSVWSTEHLMKSLLINNFSERGFGRLHIEAFIAKGQGFSEQDLKGKIEELERDPVTHRRDAQGLREFAFATSLVEALAKSGRLRVARAFDAFAVHALKIGSITEHCIRPGSGDTTPLQCTLTGVKIVPGQTFYIVQAHTRPTEEAPSGEEMVATVAKHVSTSDFSLSPESVRVIHSLLCQNGFALTSLTETRRISSIDPF